MVCALLCNNTWYVFVGYSECIWRFFLGGNLKETVGENSAIFFSPFFVDTWFTKKIVVDLGCRQLC